MLRCLYIGLLLVAIPTNATAQNLDRARQLMTSGHHRDAQQMALRALELRPAHPVALEIYVAASCQLKDAAGARLGAARLPPTERTLARRLCARHGVSIGPAKSPVATVMSGSGARGSKGDAVETVAKTASDPRQGWQIAFWSSLSAFFTSATITTVFAFRSLSYRRKLEDHIAATRELQGMNVAWTMTDDPCAAATNGGAGAEDATTLCRRGKNATMAANVFLAVSAVLGVTGGYFFYRGYVRSPVRVTPTFAQRGGGLKLSLDF